MYDFVYVYVYIYCTHYTTQVDDCVRVKCTSKIKCGKKKS